MSNGYLIAAGPDLEAAAALAAGFGLVVVDAATVNDLAAAGPALAEEENIGILLSAAAAGDASFVALLQVAAQHCANAQLILRGDDARAAFPFVPEAWPAMSLADAEARAHQLAAQGAPEAAPEPAAAPAPAETAPAPPAPEVVAQEAWPAFDSSKPADVFLSFSTLDRDSGWPLRVANALAARGLNVWSANSPDGGFAYEQQREARLRESGVTVVLWSALSADSVYVRDEAETAQRLGKLLAVRLDDAALPAAFESLHSMRVTDNASLETFSAAVATRRTNAPGGGLTGAPPSLQANDLVRPAPVEDTPAPPPPEVAQERAPEPAPELPPMQAAPAPMPQAAAPAPMPAPAPAPAPMTEQTLSMRDAAKEEEADEAPATRAATAAPPQPAKKAEKPADRQRGAGVRGGETAPADATAFAPKKLRRGTPELVRIVMHQPKDLRDVIKAARKIDPRADAAPQAMPLGEVAMGAEIGVSLDVRGGACEGEIQRRVWKGEPIDFSFTVEAENDVKQVVILARVFIDDAQIGVLAFTRPVMGAKPKPADNGDGIRLKRHKRVFLSYSAKDREVVSAIATAYERAGVEHFWDRASLKPGEEWSPRLLKEIDRSDLFHLCWSKSASASQWVEKEALHALKKRKSSNGKRPDITVQMLDGPPWAPHPQALDSINFDDFVRAAIVGYARGDG